MKWQKARRGGNIQDRRGMSGGKKIAFGGIGGIVIIILGLMMGQDPSSLLNQLVQSNNSNATQSQEYQSTPQEDQLIDFVDVVLASTEDVWTQLFNGDNLKYQKPTLSIYKDSYQTGGCGLGQAAFGPFYCPADQNIYLDLSFKQELSEKFGAKGEFALAYVIAHEVGHHVQHLLGVLDQSNALQKQNAGVSANKISVMTELQADFYAGVWAHHVNKLTQIELTYQDILEGMKAASSVGDDHLQEQAHGYANPETFTHGTSEQRMYWFKKGYESGDISMGDTFNDKSLR